jgi:hypothetical protein
VHGRRNRHLRQRFDDQHQLRRSAAQGQEPGAVTTGATLTITGKKIDGTTQTMTSTIATGTDNTETVTSVTTKLFVEVTAISITSGTNGNIYEIVAKTDRDISAA